MPLASVDDVRAAHRVLIYGVTGSGKSTAALALGERLGLPVHLVDEEFGFLPASEAVWTNRPDDEMRAMAASVLAEPAWIFDTAYGQFRDIALDRAQVIVALDYPRLLTLGRLLRRTIARARDGNEICNGNTESWRQSFASKDSILVWHAQTWASRRRTMRALADALDGPPVLLCRRPRDLDAALAALGR